VYVLSAVVDVTERKRAEQEIQRINLELQRKNSELQQFAYTVSHDLKSPLVTCKGFLGILRDDIEAGRYREAFYWLDRMARATARMAELIEDLLQLSRIGTIRNEPEDIDTSELVHSIVADFRSRLEAVSATIEIQENLPRVTADRLRFAEVIENLLSNAINYGCRGPRPTIQIGGGRRNGEVRFFVRDNGPGIAPEFHQRIFGLFQRLEPDRGGTGVGLAAVHRIMELHGGRVWVDSAPGTGAVFWLAFPKPSPQPGEQQESDPSGETARAISAIEG
jgi:signal transduction histidine kinase